MNQSLGPTEHQLPHALRTSGRHERKSVRAIVEFCVGGLCGLVFAFTLVFFLVTLLTGSTAGTRDFTAYWAVGRQLAHHANPYDSAAIVAIERAAGLSAVNGAMFVRNPPWMLPILYPLGFIGLRTASMVWSLLLIACLAVSVRLLWEMHGLPRNRIHLLGLSFAPALACLIAGQSSLFALLGLVLFLRLHRTRLFLAGLALWLCMLKPHLFLPFGVVLLAWVVVTRSYRLVLGGAVAMAASCVLAWRIDPLAWSQYGQMMRTSGIEHEFIPCLSDVLRLWISPDRLWIQYVPAALACVWALWYYWARRAEWDWRTHGGLMMLVSLIAAPYSWLFDQVLVLPALLQGAYLTRSRYALVTLAAGSMLVELALCGGMWMPQAMYLWSQWALPAWFGWYLIVCYLLPQRRGQQGAGSAGLSTAPNGL
jgi:Glycosyltransferase family 87